MSIITEPTALIPRTTLTQMAENWQAAEEEIREAYRLLEAASQRLKIVFSQDGYFFGFQIGMHSKHYDTPEDLLKCARKDAWQSIIKRMELRRIMSVKAAEEMDKQLEGDELPDITAPNLIAMLEGTLAKAHDYIKDAVKEVYDYLRPSPECWRFTEYKTNQKSQFELSGKVIITGACELWGREKFRVNNYREQMIRAIDNVFHSLDGNGTVKTSRGPLVDAISDCLKSVGTGETDYFRFKCFKNSNLHLEFKRADLVAKLNQIAGGMNLKP
jgi:uncharacterized protein DUF4942